MRGRGRGGRPQKETIIGGRPACPPMGWRDHIGLLAIGYAPFPVADIVLGDIHMATGIGFICLACTFYVYSRYEGSAESRRVGRQAGKECQA